MSLSIQNSNLGDGSPPADLPALPVNVGKYVLRRELGRGGMGIVYEGEDPLLHRSVAIKLLQPQSADPAAIDRLLREARWAAQLNHPNAVAVYDAGEIAGGVYIAMELVRGCSACDRLQRSGAFPWQEATRIVAEVCQALSAAHAAGLVHRDIKPGNILLIEAASPEKMRERKPNDSISYKPWAKLSDFGLSRSLHGTAPATIDGQVIGTPHYMSPEQIRGEKLDERTDIYSLGATYYSLLTGRFPFEREDVIQILFAHCSAVAPDPAQFVPSLPPACSQIVARCLMKEPRDRYRCAADLQYDLQALLAGEMESAGLSQRLLPHSELNAISSSQSLTDAATMPAINTNRVAALPATTTQNARRYGIALAGLFVTVLVVAFAWRLLGSAASPGMSQRTSNELVETVPSASKQDISQRPALPADGFHVDPPWTSTTDGCLLADGEMEFTRLAADGRTLAWGVSEGELNTGRLTLFDLERQEVVGMYVNSQRYVSFSAVAFPSERFVLLAYSSRVIAIDRDTQETTTLIELGDGSSRTLDVSPDGRRLAHGVVGWNGTGRVELYDLVLAERDGPRVEKLRLANREHRRPVKSVAFSPDGLRIASADEAGAVIVGDGNTGETVHELAILFEEANQAEIGYCVQFSPNGKWVAAGGHRGVVLWDVESGERRVLPEKHNRGIMSLAFSQSSEFIASGTTDGIRIWNITQGWQAGQTLEGHEGNVITGMAFARDDRLLITSGFDRRIHFWNLNRLKRSANEQ